MRLLFINALKGLKRKKLQMAGIIFLVILSTAIYTMMNMAIDSFEEEYYNYKKEQNVEDLSISLNIDYNTSYTYYDVLRIKNSVNFNEDEKYVISLYLICLSYKNCDTELLKNVSYIFDKYNLNESKKEDMLSSIAVMHRFKWEYTKSKLVQEDNVTYRVMPYDENKIINKPYLLEGSFPKENNEVTILKAYANANKLKIGDNIKLLDNEYKIVGYAYASDYMYPLISISTPMFNESKNNIVFMTKDTYSNFNGIEEVSTSIKFYYEPNDIMEVFKNESRVTLSMYDLLRLARTESPKMEFDNDRLFAQYFLYVLLGISVIIILVIAKKRIEDERLQIGVLKALGYSSSMIATSYLVYPIIGGIIGGSIGFGLGYLLHPIMTNIFVSYFNIPINTDVFDINYLIRCTLVPTIVLSVLTFIISVFMLRHKALYLLREGSNIKINAFNKFVSLVIRKLPFKSRFRYSLASRSVGKLLIVSLTSFFTGMLVVLTLIGMNLFSSIIDKTFTGLNFDYVVSYIRPINVETEDDVLYQTTFKIEKLYNNKGEEKELIKRNNDKAYEWTINGIDSEAKYINIYDINNDKIDFNLLKENKIIINRNISELLKIKVGDKIKFENIDNTYEVIAIDNSFMMLNAYVNREELCKTLEKELSYNTKYSKNSIYSSYSKINTDEMKNISNIFSIKDLKDNMSMMMKTYNYSIYIVIAFAAVMALIIISVIANIVVEENKKTISLMKVMGYKNMEISSIVLNIYTPFVVIAYLLSIPAMIALLKYIVSLLTKNIDFAIPIGLSYDKALIGLVALLIGYYVAIILSRKALNKVPLAVALKRE